MYNRETKLNDIAVTKMSDEAEAAINAGLFPGATVKKTFPGSQGFRLEMKTNLILGDGEEMTSSVDGETTLVGKSKIVHNPLNGRMVSYSLRVKGE